MKMSKLLLLTSIVATLLISCQKEVDFQNQDGNGGPISIIGDYDFLGSTVETKVTVTSNSTGTEEKIITTSDYITQNNTGTVSITATTITTSNLSYSINDTAFSKMYLGGVLVNSIDAPMVYALPATGSTTNYQTISSDSIYMSNGVISGGPSAGSPALPIGARISWSGGDLLMKMSFSLTTMQDIGGVMAQVVTEATQIVRLKKK